MGFFFVFGAIFLVASNLAILLAIGEGVRRKLVLEVSILITVFFTSSFFHLCQVEVFCFDVDAKDWQRADHFVVYVALIWFAMYFADIPERTRAAVTFFLLPVLLLLVSKHLNEMIVTIVVVSIVVLMIILGVEYAWFSRGIFEVQWSALLVSVLFLAAGVVLHLVGGDYKNGEGIYPLYHSFWHVLAMISLFFILGSRDTFAPPPPKKQKKERKKRRKKREKSAPV